MAKEIPFFKFFVGEWANGDITAENYKTQGVFINICSIYWTKEGKVSEVFLKKKLKANKEISILIESGIIKVENGNILISFLDEQLSECEGIRVKNSAAGKESARKRALNKRSTGVQHKPNETPTKSQPLREDKDKIREEKKREEFKEQNYKPDFNKLFSKIKNRIHQDWIMESFEARKKQKAGAEKTVQEFMDGTMKMSIYEFCKSSEVYGIKFVNESGAIKYWKLASKGYISDVDVWRKKLKAITKRSEEQIARIN